ncbi:hypothetical protein TSAR_013774 [Trichomalopsis sarcophagae]|uniref:Uncharacterized protein n=1 Tax=Trichomalopsis sarcophagae TaxID=543379 RepID=A0A232FMN5_9HYME|nr:hypothetical protein TSAR_013774 [Trichomalopsis sarcophagae]
MDYTLNIEKSHYQNMLDCDIKSKTDSVIGGHFKIVFNFTSSLHLYSATNPSHPIFWQHCLNIALQDSLDSAILPLPRTTLLQPGGNVATHRNVRFFIARLIFFQAGPNILGTLPEDCITEFRNIARNLINIAVTSQGTSLLDCIIFN